MEYIKKDKKRSCSMNNGGFSLVELIIVIAIMAVLVGVVGTQVIPYMENSRKARDYQIFSSWNTAAMSAYAMHADKLAVDEEYVIIITNSEVVCEDENLEAQDKLIDTFCTLTSLKTSGGNDQISGLMKSKAGKEIKAVEVTINPGSSAFKEAVTQMYLDETCNEKSIDFSDIENE